MSLSMPYVPCLIPLIGLTVSEKKLVHPSTCVNCRGIIVDTKNFTLALPAEKLQQILDLCIAWHHKEDCTKRQLQSLLGSLFYVSKCV